MLLMKGGSFLQKAKDFLSKAHAQIKKEKTISRALGNSGYRTAAGIARQLGYGAGAGAQTGGKRRKRRTRRVA